MNESEKASVRACLYQVIVGLAEARAVRAWWERKGPGTRMVYQEFESLVGSLRRSEDLK
jgi:hypothetical protein